MRLEAGVRILFRSVVVIRGTKRPCHNGVPLLLTSNIAELSGGLPVVLIEIHFCPYITLHKQMFISIMTVNIILI